MNQETKLKLQAHLDGELGEGESRKVAAWLDQDPEARELSRELNEIKGVLRTPELEVKLPESREFYWSKIERALVQQPSPKAPALSWLRPWWMRLLAPAMGVAVLLIAALSIVKLTSTNTPRLSYLHEIETPLEDTSAISFHSESSGITVVWVETHNAVGTPYEEE